MSETEKQTKQTDEEIRAEIRQNFQTIIDSWPIHQLCTLEGYAAQLAYAGIMAEQTQMGINKHIIDKGALDNKNLSNLFAGIGAGFQTVIDAIKAEDELYKAGKDIYTTQPGNERNIFEYLAAILAESKPISEQARHIQKAAYPTEKDGENKDDSKPFGGFF